MLPPSNRTITIASGGTALVGRTTAITPPAPVGLPTWAASSPLNAWMEIPGTSGAGGTQIESYSGWAALPNGKLAIALAGGHTDGTKNSVAIIDLLANSPTWVEVSPESPTHTYEVAYEADGKPASCHTYYGTMWVPTTNRLMRIGAKYVSLSGNTLFGTVDGFNLATNTWDAAGTYTSIPVGGVGYLYHPLLNKVLLGTEYYDPVTGGRSTINTSAVLNIPRAPWAWDSARNQMFGMCLGDNQRSSLGLGIVAATISGTTAATINLVDNAAKTSLYNDYPEYAALAYDPVNDYFLFYSGAPNIPSNNSVSTAGNLYKITPNSTSSWPISVFTYGSGGITPAATVASGILSKFTYVPELKGFVMMATKANNLYFLRTA